MIPNTPWMIEAYELSKRYGETLAVDSLDLQVRAGEIFGFLGPNGAGKTTTIKMLVGLLRPSGGKALIGGHEREARNLGRHEHFTQGLFLDQNLVNRCLVAT